MTSEEFVPQLPKETPRSTNPDPITGEPGAHPLGTGMGAAAGGATGAAIGAIGGPIGMALGAVIGAVAGGYAGKGVGEWMDPSAEDAFWRENHNNQPYAADGPPYEEYAPSYRLGYTGYNEGQTFEDREDALRMEYEGGPIPDPDKTQLIKQPPTLHWDQVRPAVRAAYERVGREHAIRRAKTEPQPD